MVGSPGRQEWPNALPKSGCDFGCRLDSVTRAFYCPQSLLRDFDGDTEPESDSEKALDLNIRRPLEISQGTAKASVPARRQIEAPAGQSSTSLTNFGVGYKVSKFTGCPSSPGSKVHAMPRCHTQASYNWSK
ncbi:hypothetical protein CIHG_05098 [Coccidioides immitis H538.4]|uniref:Uncharacterized protein n=1 Tax=Coccidioides immitis H538.4 TaxID=396776 RepID=A0A0J8RQT1_COCIT|nr:hypothetical protein CIHG_05098 [Coccidioides immitis H538.4]